MQQIFPNFLHLLADAVPLFLIGAALGAAVEAWLNPQWIERWIGGGHRSVAAAAIAGAVLPGCAMSTMPLAQSLSRRGAATGTLTAFIMIAPILSPHTILLTATLVSLPMAIARVLLSFVVSLALGAFLNARQTARPPATIAPSADDEREPNCCTGGGDALPMTVTDDAGCSSNEEDFATTSSWRRFVAQFSASLRSLTPFLVGGLLAAAAVSALVPPAAIERYLHGGWTAYVVAALAAFPIYVCDGGEIPLTRALIEMGVGSGPAFCFMLASVGTCLPTIAMATRIVGWFATVAYLVAWTVLAIGGGIVVQLLS